MNIKTSLPLIIVSSFGYKLPFYIKPILLDSGISEEKFLLSIHNLPTVFYYLRYDKKLRAVQSLKKTKGLSLKQCKVFCDHINESLKYCI